MQFFCPHKGRMNLWWTIFSSMLSILSTVVGPCAKIHIRIFVTLCIVNSITYISQHISCRYWVLYSTITLPVSFSISWSIIHIIPYVDIISLYLLYIYIFLSVPLWYRLSQLPLETPFRMRIFLCMSADFCHQRMSYL